MPNIFTCSHFALGPTRVPVRMRAYMRARARVQATHGLPDGALHIVGGFEFHHASHAITVAEHICVRRLAHLADVVLHQGRMRAQAATS